MKKIMRILLNLVLVLILIFSISNIYINVFQYKKADIIYTVNEKINAIAPKITDKGASAIQLQINQTVIKTVSTVVLDTLREIGIPEEMIPTLANQAINDACTPGNPREVTVDDIIALYKEAY